MNNNLPLGPKVLTKDAAQRMLLNPSLFFSFRLRLQDIFSHEVKLNLLGPLTP